MTGRTWIVLADGAGAIRTAETDESAHAAGWGIAHETGESLPPYRGVWLAPNGWLYHLYSDYPEAHHIRFGWVRQGLA